MLTDAPPRKLIKRNSSRVLAAEEREHFGHKHTGTEHLLLGITRGSSDAAKILEKRGLTLNRVRDLVSHRRMKHRVDFDFNFRNQAIALIEGF